MEDVFKPSGTLKANKPDAGGAVIRSTPVFGIVKNNIDPIRSGRIQVYISDIGTDDPENPEGWATVSYLPPFFGFIIPKAPETGYGNYVNNPTSYGMWNSPPDIGTTVICIFVNGDPNYGFYIGCVTQPDALQMVPAIGASTNVILNNEGEGNGYGGAQQLPVTNININNPSIADTPYFLNEPKPVHSYAAGILSQQGLIRDTLRGTITTSSQRETPSRVGWGISTPGRPIFSGGYDDSSLPQAIDEGVDPSQLSVIARRSGHSFVMDDGDLIGKDQLIRIRSAAGHQILMSDDGQTLFIIHSNGQSYIELGKEGTIDLFCTNSFNVRTQGDINLHADNNFNIHAAKSFNIQAEDININSEKSTAHKIGTNYSVYTMGKFTHKVDGAMSLDSSGEASFASSSTTYINGSRINLNTGSTSNTPQIVPAIPLIAHTDTLFDKTKGYAAAPGKLQSITSRAPAHTPWANANQGVDVKTSSSASKELPAAPPKPVSEANAQAQTGPVANPVTQSGAATVPPVNAASESLDSNTTGAMVGAIAKNAATGPAAAAVQQGAGVVNTAQGKIAAIGSLAQTPAQLESSGIIKPGASKVIDGMVNSGVTINKALTDNLFTGSPGAENLNALLNNTQAQVQSQVTNIQKSQTALTNAGVISGKESPVAIAGVVMAGATAGIGPTISGIKNIASQGTNLINNPLTGATNGISCAISSGNLAAGLAQNAMGGLGSISGAVSALPKIEGLAGIQSASRGASAAAFSAITGAWKPLLVGVPQNLQAIAKTSAALGETIANGNASPQQIANRVGAVANAAGERGLGQISSAFGAGINAAGSLGNATSTGQVINAASNLLGSAGKIGSALGNKGLAQTTTQVSGVLKSGNALLNSVNKINNATNVGQVLAGANSALSNINRIGATLGVSSKASGLINLPGGQLSVSSIVNQALGKTSLPALPGLKQAIGTAVTSTLNKIPVTKGILGGGLNQISGLQSKTNNLQSLALGGLPPGAAAQLNSAISSLSSAGSTPIKLPTVGLNTFDRSELTSQVNSLLGDSRIPRPTFSPVSTEAIASLEEQNKKFLEILEKRKETQKLLNEVTVAKTNYYKLEGTLPKGDPALEEAKQQWKNAFEAYSNAVDELQLI